MQTKRIGWIHVSTLLALFVLFSTPWIASAQETQIFSSGVFRIYQVGEEVGEEEYTLIKEADGWRLDSVVSITGVFSIEQHLKTNTNGEIQDYHLRINVQGQLQELFMKQVGGELDYRIKVDGNAVLNTTFKGSALGLDNNIWSHFILAIARYDRAQGGTQYLKVAVAQALPYIGILDVPVQLVGTSDGLDEYSLILSGLPINVWTKAGTCEVVRITIPMQSIEVVLEQQSNEFAVNMLEPGLSEPLPIPAGVVEREVAFEGYGTVLRGSLTLPSSGSGPWPGVVLIAGSGPTDRDGNNPLVQGRIDNLRAIVYFLSENGYAVLRYDKRGIGQSDAIISIDDIAFDYYVQDVVCAYNYLELQEDVIAEDLSLVGHSEGALLALLAAHQINPKSIVLLAGSGQPLGQTILVQVETQLDVLVKNNVVSDEEKDKAIYDLSDCIEAVTKGQPYIITSKVSPLVESLILSIANQRPFTEKALAVNPIECFSGLDCPVLIVQGGTDTQILWTDAVTLLKAAKEAELVATLSYFPVLDHVFKPAPDGARDYAEPNRSVDTGFLAQLLAWMNWVHK